MKTLHEFLKEGVYVPSTSLNFARTSMPQIQSNFVPDFIGYLRDNGIRVDAVKTKVDVLKPSQREINTDKVTAMLMKPEQSLNKPIIVSNDNYVFDGHHRWLALLNKDPDTMMNTYRVNAPITSLINMANHYERVTYKNINEKKKK